MKRSATLTWNLGFMLAMITLCGVYGYHEVIHLEPQSIHQWRQCDCLSLTQNYYQDRLDFGKPEVHNLGEDGSGKTISECPILYYTIANIWQLTGPNEAIYRGLVLLLFLVSLFILFRSLLLKLRDPMIAAFIPLLLFTSPTLVYYANNFLMNMPALSMAILGFSYFIRFEHKQQTSTLILCAVFYTLAGLLKVTGLISFMAVIGIFVFERIGLPVHERKHLFQKPLIHGSVLLSVLLIQVAWYSYARSYNQQFNAGNFLLDILPIWEMDQALIKATFTAIGQHMKWDYFRSGTLIALAVAFLWTSIQWFKNRDPFKLLMLVTAFGALLFSMLFFSPLKDHDYYTINLFILVPIILLPFFRSLELTGSFSKRQWVMRALLVAFLMHNADFARRRMEGRYNPSGWQNELYSSTLYKYRDMIPYMRSIGIEKEDRVLSLSDTSINVSLYLMNQKGWTNYNVAKSRKAIDRAIKLGARYIVLHDPEDLSNAELLPFLSKPVGSYEGIHIFKL